jgi:hypothetical protein
VSWKTDRITLDPTRVSLALRGLQDPGGHYPLTLAEVQRRARVARRRLAWRRIGQRVAGWGRVLA